RTSARCRATTGRAPPAARARWQEPTRPPRSRPRRRWRGGATTCARAGCPDNGSPGAGLSGGDTPDAGSSDDRGRGLVGAVPRVLVLHQPTVVPIVVVLTGAAAGSHR